MSIREVYAYRQRLNYLFKKADILNDFKEDSELLSHWARYLCVQVSNYLDFSLQKILLEYSKNKSHQNVARYVDNKIGREYNLNAEKINIVINMFCPEWAKMFENFLGDKHKAAINAIYGNRKNIVHGDHNIPINISFVQVKEYYKSICDVIDYIKEICID